MKTILSPGKLSSGKVLLLLIGAMSLLTILINVAIIYIIFVMLKSRLLIYVYGFLIAMQYGYNLFQIRTNSLNYYQKVRKKIAILGFREIVYLMFFMKYFSLCLYIAAFYYFGYHLIALFLGIIILIEAIEYYLTIRYILNN